MKEFLIISTILSILMLGFGITSKSSYITDAIKPLSIISLSFVFLFGWLMGGFVFYEETKSKPLKDYTLNKQTFEIKIQKNSKEFIFNKNVDFKNINDTTTFYIEMTKNLYNITTEKRVYYIADNKKFYSKR